ncbi:hypothetical protein AN640_08850 [Candidatus Epulonipiscium fishelsonii]|uniref:Uncharacterized protein n=1 Tax=Candidatus Epulonipiscium fishelsonii TaxID=77094 RepID=A0ACC8XCF2_9FIRM|nr:hypothetical protein AN640_08850 [Epulopiscium sp. SCG-D08WGA-EpuloA1]
MKNTCIFDLDGTLIDSLDSLLISVNTTLDRLNFGTITKNNCRDFIVNGAKELVKKSIIETQGICSNELLEKAMIIYKEVFQEFCTYNVVPYDGIVNLLENLKIKGFKLAVLSNKPHEETVKIVKQYFGKNYFDFIKGQTDDMPRKPNPSGLIYIMQQLGSATQETLYIGDSEVDIETGIAAFVNTVGVTWGFRKRDIIAKMQPTKIVDSAKELLEYIYIL